MRGRNWDLGSTLGGGAGMWATYGTACSVASPFRDHLWEMCDFFPRDVTIQLKGNGELWLCPVRVSLWEMKELEGKHMGQSRRLVIHCSSASRPKGQCLPALFQVTAMYSSADLFSLPSANQLYTPNMVALTAEGFIENLTLTAKGFLSPPLSPPVQIARWAHMCRFLSVCLSVFTQATVCTSTMVYGVLVHQQGAICTTKAQYAPWCTRETMFFLK